MKLKKKQQQFIKDAYNSSDVCDGWKTKIKDAFPKLFTETELVIGEWYKYNNCTLCYQGIIDDTIQAYGCRNNGKEWLDLGNMGCNPKEWIKATDKEVTEALINEAKRRGFKEGVCFKCFVTWDIEKIKGKLTFEYENKSLYTYVDGCLHHKCFEDGKWAEILETITKEEA